MENIKKWRLFRLIIPAFPRENVFTYFSKGTTALGPIIVATVAAKLWGWRVEVIDENNYRGPRDSRHLPDHETLQRENPADVVGFYCGLTSTIERVWDLSKFYHGQNIFTVAGAWHAHYCPEETLRHDIDIVVHGDGDVVIRKILQKIVSGEALEDIPGVSFLKAGQIVTNAPEMLENPDLDDLPIPDFGLLRYANKIKVYPVSRIMGCEMRCEFCQVCGSVRWASAQHLFKTINWLVETRKARRFFLIDDRVEGDLDGTMGFFKMVAAKYGRRLNFLVQARLEAAKNIEFLEVMYFAGVRLACIGYESPIDEELRSMRKGYLSKDMLKWTNIWQRYFPVHGMFMFGYPLKPGIASIKVGEMVKRFKCFIREGHFRSIQIMHPGPGPGTDLRKRLGVEGHDEGGRIFSLDKVPWLYYDGNFACFKPDNMTLREFQEAPVELMRWFYGPLGFITVPLKTLAFPVTYFFQGWKGWHREWYREVMRTGGYFLVEKWRKRQKKENFLKRLERH